MTVGIIITLCLIVCYLIARTMYKDFRGLRKAFTCGFAVGCASIASLWALAALPLLIWYLYSPMKINNEKVFYSATLGALAPLWLMLPYWLFL